ncbi:hypothetical protein LCGC14_1542470, partial [marine sediment metagenome]
VAAKGHTVCLKHLEDRRVTSRLATRRLRRLSRAAGLCPRCHKRPTPADYKSCQFCRTNRPQNLRRVDKKIDYEENMQNSGHYRLARTAFLVGLCIKQLRVHIKAGHIHTTKDRWGRLWVRRTDRANFLRFYSRGWAYGS